ncbi:ABC transporter permease [Alkalibacterium gilvum]|uniref:ABC transporter permease n=1 Tax=Alkalibacterium gilvum TaxID=1130080 RepID=UPI003F93189E
MVSKKNWIDRWTDNIQYHYKKAYQNKSWRMGLFIFGMLFQLIIFISYLIRQKKSGEKNIRDKMEKQFNESGRAEALRSQLENQEKQKIKFLNLNVSSSQNQRRVEKLYKEESNREISERVEAYYENDETGAQSYLQTTLDWLSTTGGLVLSLFLAWPMYLFLIVVSLPSLHYLIQRLLMMFFVIIGVTVIVFTLLYLSPSDPATNILGNQATPEQVENFRQLHGLNDSYFVQLGETIKGIFTFDLGNAYAGNERVVTTILRRFPITLKITLYALGLSVAVALPAGIYAAVKTNTTFDQLFMLIALLGISIPSFWQGLIFILTFSINLGWLPATYSSTNAMSLIMPTVVLGTGLMASVARMTRSSTLEVINEDYILTARAKGLSEAKVILRHAVPNALIPIITIIGLQFGGMLGGASVTEKVFSINGIGSYIVDKQFIPDIPSVMAGVIYIAIVLSIVNVFVDLLYSFLDPRIRSRVKNG